MQWAAIIAVRYGTQEATTMTELNTDALWMPFTANRAYKQAPRLVKSAQGVMLYTDDGREVIDGTAGLWCVNAGHCRPEIAAAVNHQLQTLDYTSVFNFGHELEFEYANRLTKYAPEGLNHVFFGNSGSEAVDTALKLAMQYWSVRGGTAQAIYLPPERLSRR